jgi:hypothetical protein
VRSLIPGTLPVARVPVDCVLFAESWELFQLFLCSSRAVSVFSGALLRGREFVNSKLEAVPTEESPTRVILFITAD